jgi:hypothetical protein
MKPVVFCSALVLLVNATAVAASGQASAPRTVPHETLKAFLPTLPGWTRGEIHGETSNDMGISISRVQADYEKSGSTLSFEIMDSSAFPAITAPFLIAAKSGMVEQTADGYTKGVMVSGFPAIETWTPSAKNGELGLLVAGRYLVKVNGNSVPDIETIRSAINAVDLKKLAAVK